MSDDSLGFVPNEAPTKAPADDGVGFVPHGTSQDDGLGFVPNEKSLAKEGKPQATDGQSNQGDLGEGILAGVEGAARGATGHMSDVALDKLGISTEKERSARAEKYPYASGVGELGGNIALFAALPELALGESAVAKVGGKALANAITSLGYQGSNEVSRAMLADPNDPTADHNGAASAVMTRMGAAGMLGLLTGGISGSAKQGLQVIGNAKAGAQATSFLAGVASSKLARALTDEESEQIMGLVKARGWDNKAFDAGAKLLEKDLPNLARKAGDLAAAKVAYSIGGEPIGASAAMFLTDKYLGPTIEKVAGKTIGKAAYKYAVPAALKAMSAGETTGLWDVLDHANNVNGGAQMIERAIENTFRAGGQQAIDSKSSAFQNEALKKFIEEGGIDQALKDASEGPERSPADLGPEATAALGFADGGEVGSSNSLRQSRSPDSVILASKVGHTNTHNSHKTKTPDHVPNKKSNIEPPTHDQNTIPNAQSPPNPIATLYPEQSMILNATKARISTYLNSVRPQPGQKLPFDSEMKHPEKERSYNRAIELANSPLSILNHIKSGEILPEHVAHFNGMYPELSQHLQKKLTEKILASQMEKGHERPSHHVIQGLSLLLGAPLDSTLTPQNIQAAQNVFLSQNIVKQNAAQQSAPKKNTDKLSKMSHAYVTQNEGSIMRRNKA